MSTEAETNFKSSSDEVEQIQDQLISTQAKLKVALTRYEELYLYAEERQAESTLASAKVEELKKNLLAKETEIQSLKQTETTLLDHSKQVAQSISKNIQSLDEIGGFIESFLKQPEAMHLDVLAIKGTRILLEQLQTEVVNLKTLQDHLSAHLK